MWYTVVVSVVYSSSECGIYSSSECERPTQEGVCTVIEAWRRGT